MYRIQEDYLDLWFKKKNRHPLIIRGARQVGKSTLVRSWCEKNKLDLVEINLEKHRRLNSIFESLDMDTIFREIEAIVKRSIPRKKHDEKKSKIILFLDEIQETPMAIPSLRYFFEEYSNIPVIAAGSLLEFTLSDHTFDMPVGRIEYLHMGPMRFDEFLIALEEDFLLDRLIKNIKKGSKIAETAHKEALTLFWQYLFVGGMPEAILNFKEERSLHDVIPIHTNIIDTFRSDFLKYAKKNQLEKIEKVFNFAGLHVGEKIKYSNISHETPSRDIKKCLDLLSKAKIITPVYHSAAQSFPLERQKDEKVYKLIHLDVGLMNHMNGVTPENLGALGERKLFHQGCMAEQFVGQHLLSWTRPFLGPKLYYWLREGKIDNAEIDYLIEVNGQLLAIEVKSGKSGTLRSLHQWNRSTNLLLHKKSIRFDLNLPSKQQVDSTEASYELISRPIYLAPWTILNDEGKKVI
ncbi:MAG: ATP-binding protein [Oligoflexia bacterium]|nr:ATP-binding protein [Oligoflexia bacterium]